QAPVAWQMIAGHRVPVAVHFALAPNGNISFALGPYDRTQPLTIDPTLSYSTYLGGGNAEAGDAITLDGTRNGYGAGFTYSTTFPTAGAPQGANSGNSDAFVSKLNPAGTALVYSTYLGGSGYDFGDGVAVDSAGNAYVAGETDSTNFPTVNALQSAQ